MARYKREETPEEKIGALMDRLMGEDPETVREFIELIRNANALAMNDPDLVRDWFAYFDDDPTDTGSNYVLSAEKQIAERSAKYQSLADALKPKTQTAKA